MSGGWNCLFSERNQVGAGAGVQSPGYPEGGGRAHQAGPLVLTRGPGGFRAESGVAGWLSPWGNEGTFECLGWEER